jgi:5,10-methylenetetrahydromethanopterin reductase
VTKSPTFDVGLDNGRTVEEIVSIARAAENSGFDTIWIAEQHFRRGAFSIAAAVAEATTTVGIGFGILSPFVRHPAAICMELVSLTEQWGDRFKLGYGVAHHGSSRLGTVPSNQVEGLREAATSTRTLLEGGTAYNGAQLDQRPPRIPLYVGSIGAQTLAMSADAYDGGLLGVMCSPAFIEAMAARIDEALDGAGRSRDEYDFGALVLASVSDDPVQAMDVARRSVAYYLMEIPDVSPRLIGTAIERDELLALRTELLDAKATDGIEAAAALLPEELVNVLAVVGTANEVARRLTELLALGLDRVAPHHALGTDAPASVRQLGAALITGAVAHD